MTTLAKNTTPSYCSEYISYNGNKYKIVVRNGNAYFEVFIYRLTNNGDFAVIANVNDIPNITRINYVWDDNRRMECAKENLEKAKEWLKSVF